MTYPGCTIALYRSNVTFASWKAADALSVTFFPATSANLRASKIANIALSNHQRAQS